MKSKWTKVVISSVLAATMTFACFASGCDVTTPVSDKYTITFNYNDETSWPSRKFVNKGESSEACATPVRAGYDFVGWATSENATTPDVVFPYTPTTDVTLYAVWEAGSYTVTFDHNHADSTPDTTSVKYENTVEAPTTDPVWGDNQFIGWFDQAEGGSEITFPYEVTEDVTFYAHWISASTRVFTINFDQNYDGPDTNLSAVTVIEGNNLTSRRTPSLKSRIGYELLGWATTPNATEALKMPYKPTDDVTLYAVWKLKTYQLKFRYNYVDAPNKGNFEVRDDVLGNTQINEPAGTPTREGYTFDGWWTQTEGGKRVDFSNLVASENVSYFAHWISDRVETNVFQAEYTYLDPTTKFPGYSGAAYGADCILNVEVDDFGQLTPGGIYKPDAWDESNSVHKTDHGHYISYLFAKGLTLTFNIYSSQAVSNVTLKANLASELGIDLSMAPDGAHGYMFKVNGTSIDYSLTLPGDPEGGKTDFKEYTIGSISLKEGWNTIELITNNETLAGGTMAACAPMVDYIKIEGASATLSYSPIYDNLWHTELK